MASSIWPGPWLYTLRSAEYLCSPTFKHSNFNISQRSDFGETMFLSLRSQTDCLLKISLNPSFFCQFPNHMLTTITHRSIMTWAMKSYSLSLLFWSQKRHRVYGLPTDQLKCQKVNLGQTETNTICGFSPICL